MSNTKPQSREIVTASVVLAVTLQTKRQISFRELRRYRAMVEKANPDLVVDISGPSIDRALENYPKLFRQEGNSIFRAAEALFQSDYVENALLSPLPPRIVRELRKHVQKPETKTI